MLALQVGCFKHDSSAMLKSWDSRFLAIGMHHVAWDVSEEKAVSRAAGPAEGGELDPNRSGSSGGQIALASCVIGDARDHDGRYHVLEIADGSYFVPSKANTTLGLSKDFFSFKDSSTLDSMLLLLQTRVGKAKSAAVQSVIQKQAAENAKIIRLSIPMDTRFNDYPRNKRISRGNRSGGTGEVLFFPIPSLNGVAFPATCTELYLDNHSFYSFEGAVFPAD